MVGAAVLEHAGTGDICVVAPVAHLLWSSSQRSNSMNFFYSPGDI